MSFLISIRLQEKVLNETRSRARALHLTQTDYIRKAIEEMNHKLKKKALQKRLQKASLAVRNESMKVNSEFSGIEHEPEI
jgi:hypothetical protein